jgi:hypothetical protein
MSYGFQEGTISAGTLRDEDLIPVFMDEAETVKEAISMGNWPGYERRKRGWERLATQTVYVMDESLADIKRAYKNLEIDPEISSSDIVDELMDMLNDVAPKGYYFGSHPGDGADFGWWANDEED